MTSTTALSIAQAIQERALASKKAEMAKPVLQRRAIKPIQIPLWDNSALAVQFDIARSALFSAKSRGKRKYFADEIIPSLSHLKILYRGEELRQRDFDVYLEILSLARGQHITSENPWTRFTARSLVRELGWTANNVSLKSTYTTILTSTITVMITASNTVMTAIPVPILTACKSLVKYAIRSPVLWLL